MTAVLAGLLAWALGAWGWSAAPPITITYSDSNSTVAQEGSAPDTMVVGWATWSAATEACTIELTPAWVAIGSPRSAIAHEVGHCLAQQYGNYEHALCECLMGADAISFDGPTTADRIWLDNIATYGEPRYTFIPMVAAS